MSTLPEDWTHWLALTSAVHNNRKNETMGLSPNQILLGHDMSLAPEEEWQLNNELAEDRVSTLRAK